MRKELGIGDDVKVVILNFGGQVCNKQYIWTYQCYFEFHLVHNPYPLYFNCTSSSLFRIVARWLEVEGGVFTFWLVVPGIIQIISIYRICFCAIDMPTVWASCSLSQVCGASDTQELPSNFLKLAKDVYTPDVIAASDCMLGRYWICF